jgi:molybdopterin adenylyltransferase
MPRAAVITVSDSCYQGQRVDVSGPAVAELLRSHSIAVEQQIVVPDEQEVLEKALKSLAEQFPLVVTTGGTGIAPRDVTPEATLAVCDRLLDGLSELMRAEGRKETPFSALSRAVCGLRGKSLILNLPGSPRGATTSLRAVLPLVPHALTLLEGNRTQHSDSGVLFAADQAEGDA